MFAGGIATRARNLAVGAVHAWRQRRLAGRMLLRTLARAQPGGYFVVVGANDGEQSDHMAPIVRSASWRGLMVEPHPDAFARLRARHGGDPRFALANVAIADGDGRLTLYTVRPPASADEWELVGSYDLLASLSRETLMRHRWIAGVEGRVEPIEVRGVRFETLCREYEVDRIDLLVIDTEGHDYAILSTASLERWRPRVVVYEHALLTPADRDAGRALLEGLGYELLEEHLDTWCLDVSVDDALTRRFRRLRPAGPAISLRR